MRSSYKLAFLLMASSLGGAACAAPLDAEEDATITPLPDTEEGLETSAMRVGRFVDTPDRGHECNCGCDKGHCSCSGQCSEHDCDRCPCGCAPHRPRPHAGSGDTCEGGACQPARSIPQPDRKKKVHTL